MLAVLLAIAIALSFVPFASANHNNKGTIKVHDEADVDPDVRNQPHVSCDFWIEGFKMGDDSGWLVFLSWPPTGDKSEVTPTGASLDWSADSGDEPGDYHFLSGPFQLDPGHYRVEAYTDDGHPGGRGHFAKAKMFWVDPCENGNGREVPCPPGLGARAVAEPEPAIILSWGAVTDADAYVIYRAESGGDFEFLDTTTQTSYTDSDVVPETTYEYIVTAVIDGKESENCESIEIVAIPFFPTLVLGALAMAGSVGGFALLRRRA